MVGRESEIETLDRALSRARGGVSCGLALLGPAGIGKTQLLEHAVRSAAEGPEPLRVLRAQGVQSEAELTYAGLLELVRPLLGDLDQLPEPQALALKGALALVTAERIDRFAVGAATLTLLTQSAADDGPMLVAIEDFHWLDRGSQEAILFVARRLGQEGIVILLAQRDDAPSAPELTGIERIDLAPLSREELARLADDALDDISLDRLHHATGGNPLAATEILRTTGHEGIRALGEGLAPVPVAERIRAATEARLELLDDDARRALVVVAAAGTEVGLGWLREALVGSGLAIASLRAPERDGLVVVSSARASFTQPLLRAAIYEATSFTERHAAHVALADAAPPDSAERAWHLAAAAIGSDEEVAQALERAGVDAAARGAPATAAHALERAGELTPDPDDRARRLALAATHARLSGAPERALDLVETALEVVVDPLVRADVVAVRCDIDTWRAPLGEIRRTLEAEAARVKDRDPRRAARMLADAAILMLRAGDAASGEEIVGLAKAECASAALTDPRIEWVWVVASILRGRGADVRAPLLEFAATVASAPDAAPVGLVQSLPRALVWAEEYDAARSVLDAIVALGRERVPGLLPFALATQAELDFRTGRWPAALAAGADAVALAAEFGQPTAQAFALAGLARVQACTGRDSDARESAASARALGERNGSVTPIVFFGGPALGLLALGRRRPLEAIEALAEVSEALRRGGVEEPGMVAIDVNLAEAYGRAGRTDLALALLDRTERSAARAGRGVLLGGVARCRGMLEPDERAAEAAFRDSLERLGMVESPFELARTELCFGERLRRARRRAEARGLLESAAARFESLGAAPWSEIAAEELGASGRRRRGRDDPESDLLTPRELQLALVVADGATNKEAARRLFLSEKTIEAHLARIYRKVGVRSRTELAALANRNELPVAGSG